MNLFAEICDPKCISRKYCAGLAIIGELDGPPIHCSNHQPSYSGRLINKRHSKPCDKCFCNLASYKTVAGLIVCYQCKKTVGKASYFLCCIDPNCRQTANHCERGTFNYYCDKHSGARDCFRVGLCRVKGCADKATHLFNTKSPALCDFHWEALHIARHQSRSEIEAFMQQTNRPAEQPDRPAEQPDRPAEQSDQPAEQPGRPVMEDEPQDLMYPQESNQPCLESPLEPFSEHLYDAAWLNQNWPENLYGSPIVDFEFCEQAMFDDLN